MNLREYLITIILILAVAVGVYGHLKQELVTVTEQVFSIRRR